MTLKYLIRNIATKAEDSEIFCKMYWYQIIAPNVRLSVLRKNLAVVSHTKYRDSVEPNIEIVLKPQLYFF